MADRSDRLVVAGLAVVAGGLALGVAALLFAPSGPAPTPPAAPAPARSAPAPFRPPPSPTIAARVALPKPSSPPSAPARKLTGGDKLEMNTAVDEVVVAAREACLDPWAAAIGLPEPVDVVLDVVAVEGEVADFGIRSLGPELTPDAVDCVADAVWNVEWPRFPLEGEVRLQRELEVVPAAPR